MEIVLLHTMEYDILSLFTSTVLNLGIQALISIMNKMRENYVFFKVYFHKFFEVNLRESRSSSIRFSIMSSIASLLYLP